MKNQFKVQYFLINCKLGTIAVNLLFQNVYSKLTKKLGTTVIDSFSPSAKALFQNVYSKLIKKLVTIVIESFSPRARHFCKLH